MKANEVGRKIIKVVNSAVNLAVLTVIILLITYAGYALWDSNQIHNAADKSHYAIYKPTVENQGKSFKELQALNPDVFAWLSVYGTNIDYPVTQGPNNMKYVNTNAQGLYSLSGSIFLDYQNSKNFSDFNSILYGHHMEKRTMFGEIGRFADRNTFNAYQYGSLYFNEQEHGIEFFAFIHANAYDKAVFTPDIQEDRRQIYLDGLLANAMYKRDISVTAEDHIVLFTTCSISSTNGRDILIGRITDEVYQNPFLNSETSGTGPDSQKGLVRQIPPINFILIILPAVLVFVIYDRRKHRKGAENDEQDKQDKT